MDLISWQELDQYEQQKVLNQRIAVKENTIKDLEVAVDFLRGINSDLLTENHVLLQLNIELEETIKALSP